MNFRDSDSERKWLARALLANESLDTLSDLTDIPVSTSKPRDFFAAALATFGNIGDVPCSITRAGARSTVVDGFLEGTFVIVATPTSCDQEDDAQDCAATPIRYILEQLDGRSATGGRLHLLRRYDATDASPLSDAEFQRFFDLRYHSPFTYKRLEDFGTETGLIDGQYKLSSAASASRLNKPQ